MELNKVIVPFLNMKEKTINIIIVSFNELIKTYSLNDITVEMILKKSKVGKTTFYRYFKDKYDVANSNFSLTMDFYLHSKNVHGYYDYFLALFTYFKKYWKDFTNAFGNYDYQSLNSFIGRYSYEVAENITKANRDGVGFSDVERLQMDLICFGLSNMVSKWIKDDYNLKPNEAALALYDIIPETLKKYWI